MTIPTAQLKHYCCAEPALQWEWNLGQQEDDPTQLVVLFRHMRCVNCHARYRFKGGGVAEDNSAILLDVEIEPAVLQ